MKNCCAILGFCLLSMVLFCGCATDPASSGAEQPAVPPLRVGITPDSPPVIFMQNVTVVGIEADMARLLAARLGRPLQFVELRWDDQIQALLDGKIDIIMSGMSVTDIRKTRIDFTEPYLKSGLAMMIRAGDERRFGSVKSVMQSNISVGVVRGTTGEGFATRGFPRASQIVKVPKARDAVYELQTRRIDVFIYDAPEIAWLVSENEARLSAMKELLNEEYLAWGVRRGDEEFRSRVNAVLGDWKKDGTLDGIIRKWLPVWKDFGTR